MPPDQPTLKHRLAHALFGNVIDAGIEAAVAAAVSVRVADDPGWHPLTPADPHDRDYADWLQDQTDALEAWRKSLTVRRVVTLSRHADHQVSNFLPQTSTPSVHEFHNYGRIRAGENRNHGHANRSAPTHDGL